MKQISIIWSFEMKAEHQVCVIKIKSAIMKLAHEYSRSPVKEYFNVHQGTEWHSLVLNV